MNIVEEQVYEEPNQSNQGFKSPKHVGRDHHFRMTCIAKSSESWIPNPDQAITQNYFTQTNNSLTKNQAVFNISQTSLDAYSSSDEHQSSKMLHTISGLKNILSTKMLDESLVTIKTLKQIKRNTHIDNKRS